MRRKTWVLAGAAVLLAGAVGVVGIVATSGAEDGTRSAANPTATTAKVERGPLASMVSAAGTLTHRARADGSPYVVINHATGTYTELPEGGGDVGCGDVLYRVDDEPVLLLCGTVPAYRDLHAGDVGNDVRQLNRNLHDLGHDVGIGIDPDDDRFTWKTAKALERLQRDKGFDVVGVLAIDDAVFLPASVHVAEVVGALGGPAQPNAEVLRATSDTLEVRVELDASEQEAVEPGDGVRITLPGNTSATGKVDRLGTIATVPTGPDTDAGDATIGAYIALDDPTKARGLDKAPVRVEITTKGVESALSVPVTAIVGKSGDGLAVEVVRGDGRRALVAVRLGLFDATGGRVQVEGALREGDRVVVPSS